MTPLEALVELTNMGVDERRINNCRVSYLPSLYDTIMEECSEPENWVHTLDPNSEPCDSELRHEIGNGGAWPLFVCEDHDRRVHRA